MIVSGVLQLLRKGAQSELKAERGRGPWGHETAGGKDSGLELEATYHTVTSEISHGSGDRSYGTVILAGRQDCLSFRGEDKKSSQGSRRPGTNWSRTRG